VPREAPPPVPTCVPQCVAQCQGSYQTLLGLQVGVAAIGLLHVGGGSTHQASVAGLADPTGRVPRVRGAVGPI
jgi:hypothetical protein